MFRKIEINDIRRLNYLKIIKIAIGSSIAILIANILGLSYSASAGIITLLSIQDTKKQTIHVAKRRIIACAFAFITAYVLFQSIGYYTYVFGIFLFVFIAGSYLLKVEDGIAMCSVLVTHFLIEKNMSPEFIWNEILIFTIGAATGVIFNLFMPNSTKQIKSMIISLEEDMRRALGEVSVQIGWCEDAEQCMIKNTEIFEHIILELEDKLTLGLKKSYENIDNRLLSSTKYYLGYFSMRKEQVNYLKDIVKQTSLLTYAPKQAYIIKDFVHKIETQFREYNNAETLLYELECIKLKLKEESNPVTREEFENRAILYIILNHLDNFLKLKRDFVKSLSQEDINKYWNQ